MNVTKTSRNCHFLEKHKDVASGLTYADLFFGEPSFIDRQGQATGAQAHGIRYERKVQRHLSTLCAGSYVPAPWFRYSLYHHPHWKYCQPDGLIFDFNRSLIIIVEIKLSHTLTAWTQVRNLYEPVVRRIFGPDWQYAALEVVNTYDSSTWFPERLFYISRLSSLQRNQFGLLIVKERKLNERSRTPRR